MASLTGQTIQSTYDALLKISGNDALTSSLQRITDGLGNFSPLYLSTTAVEISSGLNVIGSITGSNLSGTNTGDETNSTIKSKLGAATSSNDGYLTATDWSTFNAKQNALTLTTTGNSGSATLVGSTLNIPTYTLAGLGGQPLLTNPVTGTGTSGYLTRFTGSTTLADSNIFYTQGSNFTSWTVGSNLSTPSINNYTNLNINGYTEPRIYLNAGDGFNSVFYNSYGNIGINSETNTLSTNLLYYNESSKYLSLGTNGNERLRITSAGNIGIGTSNPAAKLNIDGVSSGASIRTDNISLYDFLLSYVNGGNMVGFGNLNGALSIYAGNTERIRISSGGNVGIGTGIPLQRLHIVGNGLFSGDITASSFIRSGGTSSQFLKADGSVDSNTYALQSALSGYLPLTGGNINGSVGITNSGLSIPLTVSSSSGIVTSITGTSSGGNVLSVEAAGGTAGLIFNNSSTNHTLDVLANGASPIARFRNSSSTILAITNNSVGINTASPSERLHVNGNIRIDNGAADGGQLVLASSGFSDWNIDNISGSFRGYYGATEYFRVTSAGNFGIGTTSPQAKLHSNSDILTGYFQNGTNGIYDALKLTNNTASNTLSGNGARIQFYNNANNGTTLVGSSIRSVNVDYGWASDLVLSSVQNNGYSSQTVNDAIWIKNSGNVGIGTSSPSYVLDAYSTGASTARISIKGTTNYSLLQSENDSGTLYLGIDSSTGGAFGTGAYSRLVWGGGAYPLVFGTNATERMRITSAGNVGIGTTTLPSILTVGDNGTGLQFTNAASGAFNIGLLAGTGSPDAYIYNRANSPLIIGTNNAERMRITSAGNVGIGTTSPSRKLSVSGQTYLDGDTFVALNGGIFFSGDGSYNAGVYGRNSGLDLVLQANNSERMRITSGGNVGIGTTSPNEKLSVIGAISANNGMIVQGYSAAASGLNCEMGVVSGYVQYNAYNRSTLAYGQFRLDGSTIALNVGSGGNVGIGTSSPGYTLHVNGSVAGTSAYVNLSDERYKKDIKPIENALDKILSLNGVTFNWDKSNTDMNLDDTNHIGLIAQDVEKVLPQAVTTSNDENQIKSVAYTDIVPVLIEAIKQQQAQIEELKAKLK